MKTKAILVVSLIFLALASCQKKKETNAAPSLPAGVPSGIAGKRVAVIRNLPSDDHTKQFLAGARSQGEALGMEVDTFLAENNDVKFQELVNQAIQKNYDGFIISHGKKDYSYDMLQPAVEKGIKIVTFDTIVEKEGAGLPGITSTAQDDKALAELSLKEIVTLHKEKPVRILKLWFGPGIPPLDRREIVYKEYEARGDITTLEVIGPTNFEDVQGDVANKVAAVLAKYPPGTVDAVWGSWDEMAKGAYRALREAGRQDILVISIDISNQDINLMREEPGIWMATAAVDPSLIGQVNMRILAKKFANENTPDSYDLEAKLIRRSQLTESINMLNLKDVIPGWGASDAFEEPWMKMLMESM